MINVDFLILGAGPAGLTCARKLLDGGKSVLILEKESTAGGLCRSEEVDGAPLDIGGGHFLDVRRPKVNDFLFSFMPMDEWDYYERDSRIQVGENTINHPFEANIWQLPESLQEEYLESIAAAGCNQGEEQPERFVDWIRWKLGDKIAEDYMLPYNQKIFADELDELGTYWLEKLPNVNYEDTLASCREHHAHGTQPGHAQFYYPKKYGYGEVWIRIADSMKDNIVFNAAVTDMDMEKHIVRTADGSEYGANTVITTIPWGSLGKITGVTDKVTSLLPYLKSSAIEVRYFSNNLDTPAQWIYIPDSDIPWHRILVRHNFCPNSRGYWTETRKERVELIEQEAEYAYMNEYAYPLNTVDKPEIMKRLLAEAEAMGVYGLGRWGEHNHYNSDVVVERAMDLADKLLNI